MFVFIRIDMTQEEFYDIRLSTILEIAGNAMENGDTSAVEMVMAFFDRILAEAKQQLSIPRLTAILCRVIMRSRANWHGTRAPT